VLTSSIIVGSDDNSLVLATELNWTESSIRNSYPVMKGSPLPYKRAAYSFINYINGLNCFLCWNVRGSEFRNVHIWDHVRWVPRHHGMARPQVEDGGDALQFWRAAANILNKQSWTAEKGWSSSLGVGRGANNSSP
jgi:hypothetical protein